MIGSKNKGDNWYKKSKRDSEAANGAQSSGHSKAYHRFFEGYTEYYVPKKNGKGQKIARVYTGTWYEEKNQQFVLRNKILFSLIFLLNIVTFAVSGINRAPINMTWYLNVAQMVTIVFLALEARAIFDYDTAHRRMTIFEYKSGPQGLDTYPKICAICFLADLALALLALALKHNQCTVSVVWNILAYPFGFLCSLAIFQLKKTCQYDMIPSEEEVPEEASHIFY